MRCSSCFVLRRFGLSIVFSLMHIGLAMSGHVKAGDLQVNTDDHARYFYWSLVKEMTGQKCVSCQASRESSA